MDAGAIAGSLTGLRGDPAIVKRLLLLTKISGCNDGKKVSRTNETSPSLMKLLRGVKVLQQAIIDLLLDIIVECCQSSEGSCNDDPFDAEPKAKPEVNGAPMQLPLFERLDSGVGESGNDSAIQSTGVNGADVHEKVVPGYSLSPPEASACKSFENTPLCSMTKCRGQSEELLGSIINTLRALDATIPQCCPEPRCRPQSAQEISLVTKLVEHSEHPMAAAALLERLQKPDADPALRLYIFGALCQMECSSEVWEHVFLQSFGLLAGLNDEPLAVAINFVLKAAFQCQCLPEAISSVRVRLKDLGAVVSTCVLEFLSRTVHDCADVAEAILRKVDCDDGFGVNCSSMSSGIFFSGANGLPSERLRGWDEQSFHAGHHFFDIYILIEMLSIPSLAVEASQIFERAVSRGAILAPSVAMFLKRWHAEKANYNSRFAAENLLHMDAAVEG
ncbi:hypothetical protein Nepgr_008867 [Nepenthes gracilis]|uniref:Uncharacterized protein n=1 Tax=Nepenthes gracilis TaxID=150966 RepID=A0AAD3S9R1_NEPGR|nr:hypothetical protein Nepgr_008867 [Nepenthes gracilis]